MTEIIGIRYKNTGKIYYFAPNGIQAKVGDTVIVDSSYGSEIGRVCIENKMVDDSEIVQPLRPVNRIATKADLEIDAQNRVNEKEAIKIANDLIKQHGLEMKLVDAEFSFGGNRLSFYFTADGRVDFRELVKSLAGIFKTRIELRQIGVRDEAKMLGAVGICGRTLCCSTFLDTFRPVSIKMAKEQGLSPNPMKISGNCGRLMCCLQYEQICYDDMLKIMPSVGASVITPSGRGTVVYTEVLNGKVKVRFDADGGFDYYDVKDISVIDGAASRKNVAETESGDEKTVRRDDKDEVGAEPKPQKQPTAESKNESGETSAEPAKKKKRRPKNKKRKNKENTAEKSE